MSSKPPILSVLTPVRNAAMYVERCVTSVLALDREDVEQVIIDGGSSDGTDTLCSALADAHPGRVRFERIEDRSMTEGLLNAVSLARGTYLGPLNADDRYLPRGLHTLVDRLEMRTAEVLVGDCLVVRDDDSVKYRTHPWPARWPAAWQLLGCLTPECATFFSRAAYEKVGGYRSEFRYTQDYDLLMRLVRAVSVEHVDADVGVFAARHGAISDQFPLEMAEEFGRINAFGRAGAWAHARRIHKIGRILLGTQSYSRRQPQGADRAG